HRPDRCRDGDQRARRPLVPRGDEFLEQIFRHVSRPMVASICPCGSSIGTNNSFWFSIPNASKSMSKQCLFGIERWIFEISAHVASAASPISKSVVCTDGLKFSANG